MRLMQVKPPEPGSARDLSSKRMKEKWQDPEYRKQVSEKQKEKWRDPAYRAMILATKGNPIPDHIAPALAVHYDREVARLKRKVRSIQKIITKLEYIAADIRNGGDPKMLDKVMHGGTNRFLRYTGKMDLQLGEDLNV